MRNGKLLSLLGELPRSAHIVVKVGDIDLDVISVGGVDVSNVPDDLVVLQLNSIDLRDLIKEIRKLPR